MKATTYRILNACANCEHVFQLLEYDEPPLYFCTLNSPARPLCGSLFMNERLWDIRKDKTFCPKVKSAEFDVNEAAWSAWQEGREVATFGVCDEWKEKP